jgi:hypothetical protein
MQLLIRLLLGFFHQIFVPIQDGAHYFVYCFNFIHKHIDVLDSDDYFMKCTDQEERHKAAFAKIPIIDAAFQKVSNLKLPRVSAWRKPFIDLPKQAGPSDCLFFIWKYTEYYDGDGDSLTIEINPVSNCVYFAFYVITVYMTLATIANQKLQAHTSFMLQITLNIFILVVSQITRSCNQTLL